MLALGFSSGLPFLLVGNTFGYWLRDEGTALTAIGFLSWVGIAYSLKFLWAPLLDRLDVPLLGAAGPAARLDGCWRRFVVGVRPDRHGLCGHRPWPGACWASCALVVAFASVTQDIAIDAWRIEIARKTRDELGLLTSAYTFGYRIALLVQRSGHPAHRPAHRLERGLHVCMAR